MTTLWNRYQFLSNFIQIMPHNVTASQSCQPNLIWSFKLITFKLSDMTHHTVSLNY